MNTPPAQMPSVTVAELITRNERLFALPEAYIRLQQALREPNVNAHALARLVSQDVDITARLLKLVNGPVFGYKGRVDTVSRAIAVAGMRELEMLMLATVAAESFRGIDLDVVSMASFWQHSVFCAVVAQILAKQHGVLNPERLFVAGLLHDVGSLVLWQALPEAVVDLLARSENGEDELYALERQTLGFDHGEVGAELLARWHLPGGICAIAATHHTPQQAEGYALDAAIVHVANLLANARELPSYGEIERRCSPEAWRMLGLTHEKLKLLTGEALMQFMDAVEMLLPEIYRTR